MIDASRRASRPERRGGRANALFVVAAAEALPVELHGFANELTIHFPWGSLLRGLLLADPAIMRNLVAITRPGAVISLLLSVTEHDRAQGLQPITAAGIDGLGRRYAECGLTVIEARPATREDVVAVHSSWAKRLGAGAHRATWLVRMSRA